MDNDNLSGNISESIPKKNKSKKPIIILIIIVIAAVLAAGGYFLFGYINQLKADANNNGIVTEPNVFFNDEDAEKYLADKVSSINVTIYRSITAGKDENGKLIANVGLENKNDHQYIVEFSLADTGEKLYTTGLIPAGSTLKTIPIDKELAPGEYSVNAMFTVVSEKDNKTSLGSTGINVDMTVN